MPPKDKKSGDKKPAPAGLGGVEILLAGIFILFIASAILERLYSFVSTGDLTFYGLSLSDAKSGFQNNLGLIKVISFSFSALFALGAVIFSQLRNTILIVERKKLYPDEPLPTGGAPIEEKNPTKEKWKQVEVHAASTHPSDWRLAIIEADIILSELLDKMNLPGETIGDKLKAVEKSDFLSIESAWEAHKIRNQIAHEGSEFLLNDREARRVIDLYRQVFEEFYLI